MATPTYDLLDSVTLASSAASVSFSSISQDYRDLILICDASHTEDVTKSLIVRFNGDTGSNYSYVLMDTGPSSYGGTGTNFLVGQTTASTTKSMTILQMMDYSATDKHKSGLNRLNRPTGAAAIIEASAVRWANTSAITAIDIISTGTIATGSTFYLYGISA